MKRVLYAIPSSLLLLSSCSAVCGDGIFDASQGEQCDDGNTIETDDCLSTCLLATCGDSFVRIGLEECDDANNIDSDACTNTCNNARCGDGVVFNQGGVEICDDANNIDTDGCTNNCEVDPVIRNFEITTRKNVALTDGLVNVPSGSCGVNCTLYSSCQRTFSAPISFDPDLNAVGSYNNNIDCSGNNLDSNIIRSINGEIFPQIIGSKYKISIVDGSEAINLNCDMSVNFFDLTCKDDENKNWVFSSQE